VQKGAEEPAPGVPTSTHRAFVSLTLSTSKARLRGAKLLHSLLPKDLILNADGHS
jgi:hypothetical protein